MPQMKRLLTSELSAKLAGKQVRVSGWVFETRNIGSLIFLVLRDRGGFVQITLPKKTVLPEIFKKAEELTKESYIDVVGKLQVSKQAQRGFEIVPENLEVLSKADAPVPLDISGKIQSGLDARLDYRFLDLRQPKNQAIFKVRAALLKASIDFFENADFMNIVTPKLTSAGVESGAELFKVDYFGRDAYLSQSPQIYKQMMVCAGFEKVYEIGPVFRAEKSHTTRHLTEFTGVDFEMGPIDDMDEPMQTIEDFFKYVVTAVNKNCKEQLKLFGVQPKVPKKIPILHMREAKKLLATTGKKLPEDEDLDAEGEQMLGEIAKKEYGEDFVFVTHYPWKKRPFYHMKPADDQTVTKSYDLLWNGLEVLTGAQREHRYDVLKAQATEKGVDLDKMRDYAMIFKYGAPPHGGAGMGLDRFVESMLNLDNIREGILLPRDPLRLTP